MHRSMSISASLICDRKVTPIDYISLCSVLPIPRRKPDDKRNPRAEAGADRSVKNLFVLK